jgi:hypothetical protein
LDVAGERAIVADQGAATVALALFHAQESRSAKALDQLIDHFPGACFAFFGRNGVWILRAHRQRSQRPGYQSTQTDYFAS